MYDFLKLIRFPNLLILAFTQYVIRWCMLAPFLAKLRYESSLFQVRFQMTEIDFFILVLSTVLIAAAGYIINDYFDVRIDEVNRPATNVVGKTIKRRVAMVTHMTFNIVGVLAGIYISWKYNMLSTGSFIFISAPALLWFYSTNLKRQFLIGNLVVALLSGLIPLLGVLIELMSIRLSPEIAKLDQTIINHMGLSLPLFIALGYSLFAFLISLIREIIKDIEDYEGDMEYGCKTLPIVLGISKAKAVAIGMSLILASGLFSILYAAYEINNAPMTEDETGEFPFYLFAYVFVLIIVPVLWMTFKIYKANSKKDWRILSGVLKYIMIAGVCFLLPYSNYLRSLF